MSPVDFTLGPVRLFADDRLLSAGDAERLPPGAERVETLDRAMLLENSQDTPIGYRIWTDVLDEAVSPFYSSAEGREGRALIETEAQRLWDAHGPFERALRIKKIKKTLTPFEDFWLTVAYDSLERLKSVALGRHVLGPANAPALEAVFAVYDAGFFPCGLRRDGVICAFDPRVLEGFGPIRSVEP